MRTWWAWLFYTALATQVSAGTKAQALLLVIEKADLEFTIQDLLSDRKDEVFRSKAPDQELVRETEELFKRSLSYLDERYWPEQLTVILEYQAIVHSPLEDGLLPMSVINSYQLPRQSSIQLGMFELQHDRDGYLNVLGHEIGHMLVEWAARKTGATPSGASWLSLWDKSIYEGVADYFAYVFTPEVSGRTQAAWYYRDPFRFKSYEDSITEKEDGVVIAERGFRESGLSLHPLYQDWVLKVRKFMSASGDHYMPGSWLAGELQVLGERCGHRKLVTWIIARAAAGAKYSSIQTFLLDSKAFCR